MTEQWVVYGGDVVYAARDSQAEADRVVEEQRVLIAKFGKPRVEQRVVHVVRGLHGKLIRRRT